MINDILNSKEIAELLNDILKIKGQLSNPDRDEIINILIKAQRKYPKDSAIYETTQSIVNKGSIVSIENIPTNVLLSKLPVYQAFYLNDLKQKCNERDYNLLKEKYSF